MRLKASSSRGLATSLRYAVASLMCACSKKRMPLVMEKGDVAPGQFQLQFERVEMRAIQHGHFVQVGAFLAHSSTRWAMNAACCARRCRPGGPFEAGLARGRELLGELADVGGDGGVRCVRISGVLRVVVSIL